MIPFDKIINAVKKSDIPICRTAFFNVEEDAENIDAACPLTTYAISEGWGLSNPLLPMQYLFEPDTPDWKDAVWFSVMFDDITIGKGLILEDKELVLSVLEVMKEAYDRRKRRKSCRSIDFDFIRTAVENFPGKIQAGSFIRGGFETIYACPLSCAAFAHGWGHLGFYFKEDPEVPYLNYTVLDFLEDTAEWDQNDMADFWRDFDDLVGYVDENCIYIVEKEMAIDIINKIEQLWKERENENLLP